ncbi:hypothetical protein [Aeromonas veronii]|uniref:hypothetical protein n=1 Tax=Aeromonas TaxID=642 RepID=UPI0030049645
MQIQVIEKTFRLAGESEQVAQFTLTTSGILHIWFPEIGLQMEAHRNQLRIQNNTIIYTDRLDYGEQRAHWALTLHEDDMKDFKKVMSKHNRPVHRTA